LIINIHISISLLYNYHIINISLLCDIYVEYFYYIIYWDNTIWMRIYIFLFMWYIMKYSFIQRSTRMSLAGSFAMPKFLPRCHRSAIIWITIRGNQTISPFVFFFLLTYMTFFYPKNFIDGYDKPIYMEIDAHWPCRSFAIPKSLTLLHFSCYNMNNNSRESNNFTISYFF